MTAVMCVGFTVFVFVLGFMFGYAAGSDLNDDPQAH